MFTCEAEANPPTMRYRWEVDGVSVVGDHTSHYLMPHIQRSSNGAKVACIVANEVGTQRAEHTLSVQCECSLHFLIQLFIYSVHLTNNFFHKFLINFLVLPPRCFLLIITSYN